MSEQRTIESIMNGKSPGVVFRPTRFQRATDMGLLLITYRDGVGLGSDQGKCWFDPPPCDQDAINFAVDMLCRPKVIIAGDIQHTKKLHTPIVAGLLYDEELIDISRTTVPVRKFSQHCPACPTVVFL